MGNVGLKSDGEFKEKSDCCCRLFIRGAREFTGSIKIDGNIIANMVSPYKCHSAIPFCSCPFTVIIFYFISKEPMAFIKNPSDTKIIGLLK
jgi:hypothetical protein